MISHFPIPFIQLKCSTILAHPHEDETPNPWLPIGNFLHDWWCYACPYRHELIDEPPALADIQQQPQWAAFCAGRVEELCTEHAFPCPMWK